LGTKVLHVILWCLIQRRAEKGSRASLLLGLDEGAESFLRWPGEERENNCNVVHL